MANTLSRLTVATQSLFLVQFALLSKFINSDTSTFKTQGLFFVFNHFSSPNLSNVSLTSTHNSKHHSDDNNINVHKCLMLAYVRLTHMLMLRGLADCTFTMFANLAFSVSS